MNLKNKMRVRLLTNNTKISGFRISLFLCAAHTTALRYTTHRAYRFGHQKAVLTIVLLKMGILMLETC
jgi:hypothetical protein